MYDGVVESPNPAFRAVSTSDESWTAVEEERKYEEAEALVGVADRERIQSHQDRATWDDRRISMTLAGLRSGNLTMVVSSCGRVRQSLRGTPVLQSWTCRFPQMG